MLLLENVRFYKEEEKNDIEFSKKLSENIDFFVLDAFGTAHRAHASTAGIADYVTSRLAGLLLEKELEYLSGVVQKPTKPFVAIVSGGCEAAEGSLGCSGGMGGGGGNVVHVW